MSWHFKGWRTVGIFYIDRTKFSDGWVITFSRHHSEHEYVRKAGSPSARRCARLLAKISESEE